MGNVYEAVLKDRISKEIAFEDYIFNEFDYKVLHKMLQRINSLGYNLNYLAEIETYILPGAGEIIANYINLFSSEATRAYLIPKLVTAKDKIMDCDRLILELYNHFRQSDKYITDKGKPSSAHIYVRYDNAFHRLKPKKIKNELAAIVMNPRDMHYLPFTTRMLASWKMPQLKKLFCEYLSGKVVTPKDVGLPDDCEGYYPPLYYIRKDLIFTSIDCLRYYPDEETIELISRYADDTDNNVRIAANKALRKIKKL